MDPNIKRCDDRARHPNAYRAEGGQAMEAQAVRLLEALIYATHPRAVLEVGVWRGHTTARLRALQLGMTAPWALDAVDIDEDAISAAQARVDAVAGHDLDDTRPCTLHHADFLTWEAPRAYDVVLLDAMWRRRDAEYERALRCTHPGGLIVMHDTGNASPGRANAMRVPQALGHSLLDLALPRGLVVAQVPW